MSAYVLTAARNHSAFIDACIESVRAQTHTDWRMLVLDDGSSDDTAARVEAWCARDARIALHRAPASPSGVLGAYRQLLALVPPGHHAALLDGDDTWLPTHLAASLEALARAEAETGATPAPPTLVHGDLALVDADGHEFVPSLWHAAKLAPRPATIRRLAIDNTVTASSVLMNAALVAELRARTPHPAPRALNQDHWFALAAAALGQIVSRPDVTVRYRQHANNVLGSSPSPAPGLRDLAPRGLDARLRRAQRNTERLRRDLARSYAQATAFLESFGDLLRAEDRDFLRRYAEIPQLSRPARAWRLFTMRRSPSATLLRRIGEAVRG